MSRLSGKVALISGGAGAMGSAIARRFAETGASVVVADLKLSDAEDVVRRLPLAGGSAKAAMLDVTDEESWDAALEAVRSLGPLDTLVNNAGVVSPENQDFWEIDLKEWRRVMAVNLDGAFLGTRAAIRAMRDRGTGSIVNIASIAAFFGTTKAAAYSTSKGGVRAMTLQAAMSCASAGYKIRVNSIHPGPVWTPLISDKAARYGGGAEMARQSLTDANPLKELVEPDDVAWAAVYLASDESRRVTGSDLVVDAGRLLV